VSEGAGNTPENPFVNTMTPAMDRAQRLLSLRQHPGFRDLIRLSQDMADKVDIDLRRYPGWDLQQIAVLHARAKAALEHHEAWMNAIQEAINQGEAEAVELRDANQLAAKTPEQIVEESDMLRIRMLNRFAEMDNRIPGSY
jgi:hypothetical protein